MPCLMCDQMRANRTKLYSGGGYSGYGSEYDEVSFHGKLNFKYQQENKKNIRMLFFGNGMGKNNEGMKRRKKMEMEK